MDSSVKILVTNTGNGKDTFKLSKELEDGLTLYLTETYFELEAYETKEINTQGLETETTLKYEAYFEVESIGNENISANVVLEIKGIENSESEEYSGLNLITIATIGFVIFTIFYSKDEKNIINATFFRPIQVVSYESRRHRLTIDFKSCFANGLCH